MHAFMPIMAVRAFATRKICYTFQYRLAFSYLSFGAIPKITVLTPLVRYSEIMKAISKVLPKPKSLQIAEKI